jgi:membrane-bound lytic murein transglycosylase B
VFSACRLIAGSLLSLATPASFAVAAASVDTAHTAHAAHTVHTAHLVPASHPQPVRHARAVAQPAKPFGAEQAVADFIARMQSRHGFAAAELLRYFAVIEPNASVLRAIAPAAVPEQQRSWERYRERFVNSRRADGGLRFWRDNREALQRAEADYGVPPEIVCAIIGVETEYGSNRGGFKVFEALATLAFHYPRRAEFFREELEAFLLLARDAGVDPLSLRGSYAGAIGIPQFMPSSIRRFAVDYDGDGRIDLVHSSSDAIGSVAAFLAGHGWQPGAPVALPAHVDGDPAPLIAAGLKPSFALRELAQRGVLTGISGDADARRTAALVDLTTPDAATEYWAAFDNFWVITRYNRSSFYAMAVFQLAQTLRER